MAEFKKVTTVEELSPGQCMTAVVDERYIGVFNVDGTFHALDGTCPHQAGLLGNGTLDGCVVKCPEHGMRFDVTTGATPSGGLSVKKFAVKVEGGDVLVAMDCLVEKTPGIDKSIGDCPMLERGLTFKMDKRR